MPRFRYLLFGVLLAATAAPAGMRRYDNHDYEIYTDVDADFAREAVLRTAKMADEYRARTAGFPRATGRFPFYLYRSADEYMAAGGLAGTSGVFIDSGDRPRLMVAGGTRPTAATWHSVQHEAWHQFARSAIGDELPVWLDEGLAEYFGEGIFTGDGFVVGVVPPWRLARLKREMPSLKSFDALAALSAERWRAEMSVANYDQAWAVVHYLADGGVDRDALDRGLRDVAAGKPFGAGRFGPPAEFQKRWAAYWQSRPASPTADLYQQAACATLTSYLARATAAGQRFDDFAAFRAAADKGELKCRPADWLPASVLADMLDVAASDDHWTLAGPKLIEVLDDRTRLTGSFAVDNGRVERVTVKVEPPGG